MPWLMSLCLLAGTAWSAPKTTPTFQRADRVISIAGIYFAPTPKGDPLAIAGRLLKSRYPSFTVRTEPGPPGDGLEVHYQYANLEQAEFQPPSLDLLRYFGRGITADEATALQTSTHGLILTFNYSGAKSFEALGQISRLLADLAAETNGLIWDEDTRELFGVKAWKDRRLGDWSEGVPMVENFISIHAYKNTDYIRAITLGMGKFGLPDIVINDFSWSNNRPMSSTVNTFAQCLIEGAPIPQSGDYDLRVQSIRHTPMRERLVRSLLNGASGTGRLVLKEAERDEGDPDNRLVELTFDRYDGRTTQERQDQFVFQIFGLHDEVTRTRHTDEVLEASTRAKAKFETFRARFEKGLDPGEHILVKAPFETSDGGTEWMWVEVVRWTGGDISGLLRNEPEQVPGLHSGATVQVKQAEIFDYIRYTAEGQQEGNETGPLLQKAAE